MRLFEFTILKEYKREITQQRLGDKLTQAANNDRKQDIDTVLNTLEEIDPTNHKQYVEWLAKQYINKQFRLEDANRIKDVLTKFENIKNKLSQRDINKYTFYSLDELMDKEYGVELDTGVNTNTDIPNIKVLYKGPFGFLAIPETEEASCELGRGTKWCTAAQKDNAFDSYSTPDTPLYIWKDKSGEKYQFYFGNEVQFMDSKNQPIDHELLTYFRTKHPILSKLIKEGEKAIAGNPDSACNYAVDVIKGRFPEGEKAIASQPNTACNYARYVIKGRFPEGEKAIASQPNTAFEYARYVIKGRWPEGEKAIASQPNTASLYARVVIKGRFPEGEKAIAGTSGSAYFYAIDVIHGRWPEGEKAIASDPINAYFYARAVIKGRWPEGEKVIAGNPVYLEKYKSFLRSL